MTRYNRPRATRQAADGTMTEPRSYTFQTATLHGKVVGAGVTVLGLLMLTMPGLTVEDAPLVGVMMIVVGATFFYMSMRQSMTKEARLTVGADGVWFRDWRMDAVPWHEIADVYLGGSRLKSVICIELKDPDVGRYHARVLYDRGRFVLEDLESSNGTWLNGEKISEAALKNGDRIKIGETELAIDFD